jgi:DhnA family fructose-bisphosphate aldolase class Ia
MAGRDGAEALVILAADHRARGVITVERYREYLDALRAVLPQCDGILASAQPLADLVASKDVDSRQRTYLSINRTGLHGSVFELDDRLVAPVDAAAAAGYTGIKHMTRIDLTDAHTAGALELLGQVLAETKRLGLEALIEPLAWKGGAVDRSTDAITYVSVVAHDLGAPLIKVPVPADASPGPARVEAVARVVASVGVPVLFLGGPVGPSPADLLCEVADAMTGGAAGLAIGRTLYQHPEPARMAAAVAGLVKGQLSLDEAAAGIGA